MRCDAIHLRPVGKFVTRWKLGAAQPKFRPYPEEEALAEIKLIGDQLKFLGEALKAEIDPVKRAELMTQYMGVIERLPSNQRKNFLKELEERKRMAEREAPDIAKALGEKPRPESRKKQTPSEAKTRSILNELFSYREGRPDDFWKKLIPEGLFGRPDIVPEGSIYNRFGQD